MLQKKFFKTNDLCEVTFEYKVEAQKVALVSESNDWQPVEMKKRSKDGVFYTKMRLPKDNEFQFRYLVDTDSWANDPAADKFVANEFGGENSVVVTAK